MLAWLTAAVAVVGPTAMTLWLEVKLRRAGTSFEALTGEPMVPSLIWMMAWAGYSIVGATVVTRRRDNRIGWLLLGIGSAVAVLAANDGYSRAAAVLGMVGAEWSGWLTGTAGPGVIALVALLLATFPSGSLRVPLPRWYLSVTGAAAVVVVVAKGLRPGLSDVELPNPIQVPLPREPFDAVVFVGTIVMLMLALLALFALIRGFRRSSGVERLQLRWFVTPTIVLPVVMAFVIVLDRPEWDSMTDLVVAVAFAITFLGNAVGIGVAVTRYGLFEIDRVISRTVSWFTVTVLLVAGHAGTVLMLQALLRAVGAPDSDLVVAASTLLMAGAARPLFRRVRTSVDRRFNRTGYDAERIVGSLTSSLRDVVDPESVREALVASVNRSLQPATVWTLTVDGDISPRRARA